MSSVNDRYGTGKAFDGPQVSPGQIKPDWGYIAGYFFKWDADKKDSDHKAKELFRDYDFIRLKDDFLFVVDPKPGMKILDIGCAAGATAIYCTLQGADVTGIDLSEFRVSKANANFARLNIGHLARAQAADATSLPFPDNSFDVVTSVDFLEHVREDVKLKMLTECLRVLKPGGRMIHRTPNLAYLKLSRFFKQLKALLTLGNPFNIVIPHTIGSNPEHIGLVGRTEMERVLEKCKIRNYRFHYTSLRRARLPRFVDIFSAEVPFTRDILSNDVLVECRKSIILTHFP